jgi:hypothetical protein
MEIFLENKPALIFGAERPSAAPSRAPPPARVRRVSFPVAPLHRSTLWLGRSSLQAVLATCHAEVVRGGN